ncbi:sialate O-acetylesterase [Marinoscillum sp.]|uniref:sialate O-acetylesterase n=1 Tax=Marinoscillum sp. TaxID=2024838 RepID=UPI003BAC858A
MHKSIRFVLIILFALPLFQSTEARISLPAILGDHMVLQQNKAVKIWGWTSRSNEEIRVWGTWGADTVTTSAEQGAWSLEISTPDAGGAYSLFIEGHELIELKDVLIGEVWLASGQSNMEMPMDSIHSGFPGIENFRQELSLASYPELRLFLVQKRTADAPQLDLQGQWVVCTPDNVRDFSAVAYVFGEALHKQLNVPVGMIASSWGGTNAEVWIPKDSVLADAALASPFDGLIEGNRWPSLPGRAYNSMIYPLRHFTIKGVIWYQGESNRLRPETYPLVIHKLIDAWRVHWGDTMPFYFTEIAPFKYWNERHLVPHLREAQALCMQIEGTGMVVTNDLGDLNHIHPRRKRAVGERLSAWALAKTYDMSVPFSGPVYSGFEVRGSRVYVSFDHGEGLKSTGDDLREFEIKGIDGKWTPAKAVIKNGRVEVWSKGVREPVAVRFAWSDIAEPNLTNADGLPAACFRTDR